MLCGPHVPRQTVIDEHRRLKGRLLEFAESSAVPSLGPNVTILSENHNILKAAQRLLSAQGFNISDSSFDSVLHNHHLPCRLEELPAGLLPRGVSSVAFDVGHNPDALAKTLVAYMNRHKGAKPIVVYGCKERKDYQTCLDRIFELGVSAVYAVQAKDTKGVVPAQLIRDSGKQNGQLVELVADGNIGATISQVVNMVERGDIKEQHILVIGSFTLMREAREHFGLQCPKD